MNRAEAERANAYARGFQDGVSSMSETVEILAQEWDDALARIAELEQENAALVASAYYEESEA